MSQRQPLDLDKLPPDLRRVVEQQLAKLPPQAREKLLREGSPTIDRMLARLHAAVPPALPSTAGLGRGTAAVGETVAEKAKETARQVARMLPKGHFNATIRPGDRPGSGRWLLIVLVATVLAAAVWDDSGDFGLPGGDAVDERIEVEGG